MERENSVFLGLEFGDHTVDYHMLIDELKEGCDISKLGFILIYTKPVDIPENIWIEWANFFTANRIRFAFLYTQQRGAPAGRESHLTPELVKKIREIAGEFFVGDMIGETGGLASWPEGYYDEQDMAKPEFKNLKEARNNYVQHVKDVVEIDKRFSVPAVLCVEATALGRYNFEAGVDYGFAEMMCGNPEIILASMRGASKAYGRKWWGSHIAHEWYGGFRNDDPLKYKRLKLAYYYAFMSGAKYIYPESGDFSIESYGYLFDSESKYCKSYRKAWNDFADFIGLHTRPEGSPIATIGILQGRLDGWTGWGGSTAWNKFGDEEWAYGPPEKGWGFAEEMHKGAKWHNPTIYGDQDVASSPPYGTYDILPLEAPLEILQQYECLMFLGWNTMKNEDYEKLKAYVYNGGRLFMSLPQLSISDKRGHEIQVLNNGDFSDLFGCRIRGKGKRFNSGVKFIKESKIPGYKYPYTRNGNCDPICAAGYIQCADVEICGAETIAVLADTFWGWSKDSPSVLVENKFGKGFATLLTTYDYPGSVGLSKLMPVLLKTVLCGERQREKLKILAADSVYYSVYKWNDGYVIYLLNTDYNVSNNVHVLYKGIEAKLDIESCDFRVVYLYDGIICFADTGNFNIEHINIFKKELDIFCSSALPQNLNIYSSFTYGECSIDDRETSLVRDGTLTMFPIPQGKNYAIKLEKADI